MSFRTQSFAAVVSAACALILAACGGSDSPSPTGPLTGTSVTVSFPSGPVYIGSTTQFEARETLSDGTTRLAMSATWSSDRPQIASVSNVGQVTAVAAGEANISADVNGIRGSLLVRVFPDFGGTWIGSESGYQLHGLWRPGRVLLIQRDRGGSLPS